MAADLLPTPAEVVAAVATVEPATAEDVRRALDQPWERRGTVHNRLTALVAAGELIHDEGRPRRYAINHLEETAMPTTSVHLAEVDIARAEEAARWWREEREGWPLERALAIWLAYEANAYWDPRTVDDDALFDRWFEAVLDAARGLDS